MSTEEIVRATLGMLPSGAALPPPLETEPLGPYLQRSYPRVTMLSGGEQVIFYLAMAFWNGNTELRVAQLVQLDRVRRAQAAELITDWVTQVLAS